MADLMLARASFASTLLHAGASVVPNPAVLPPGAAQFSLALDWNAPSGRVSLFDDIELPAALLDAAPRRQVHYRAGRFCAWTALRQLDRGAEALLPRGPDGAPVWPSGFTGSITHADEFVAAAAVRTTVASAVGIDAERVLEAGRARAIATAVSWPSELAAARVTGCDRLEALTLVFSAKETLFKCVHRRAVRRFGFHEVRIIAVDDRSRTFQARLVTRLGPGLPAGMVLTGQYEIGTPWIHTGMALPPQ